MNTVNFQRMGLLL